jgi:hypothetical protein
MKEKFIEDKLRRETRAAGALCQKFTSPATRDVPDDLVTWRCEMDLVETKAPGEKCRPGQLRDHRERAALGVPVYLLDTPEKVERYVAARREGKHLPELFSVPVQDIFMAKYEWRTCFCTNMDCTRCYPE